MQISKMLKLPYTTVQSYCRSLENPKKKERKFKLTPSEEQMIVGVSKANPFKTATEIHREVELMNPVSLSTIKRVLIKNGLRSFRIDRKIVRITQN